MKAFDIPDDPIEIKNALQGVFDGPTLLNINTHRKFWHSGAGIDDEDIFDRYIFEMKSLGEEAEKIDQDAKRKIHEQWKSLLEIQ